MARLDNEFLDQIRAAFPLSQEIGASVELKKVGAEFKGLCPFHEERTPSFTVNDEKGFFHCFGCGSHGDVIAFHMKHRSVTFRDAVSALAAKAGLVVPGADDRAQPRSDGHQRPNHRPTEPDKKMLNWFASRGIPEAVVRRNKISLQTAWMPQPGREVPAICFPTSAAPL